MAPLGAQQKKPAEDSMVGFDPQRDLKGLVQGITLTETIRERWCVQADLAAVRHY